VFVQELRKSKRVSVAMFWVTIGRACPSA
jgi:hypothetical protein